MKVLHVHSGNLYGGVESTLMAQVRNRELCPEMDLSFALCFEGRFSKELQHAGAPVTFLGPCRIRAPLATKKSRQQLGRLMQEQRFDVAVTHSAWSQSLFGRVSRNNRVPLVSWIHGLVNTNHWLETWASLTPPALFIANSHFTAASIAAAYPKIRAEVVYNPLVTGSTSGNQNLRLDIRKQLRIPDESVVLIQVSRMEKCKGHDIMLRALSQLRDVTNWVCLQVGGPQRSEEFAYLDDLKSLASRLNMANRIMFLGERTDVQELLIASDVLCQPNVGPETFGNVFIEGMMARIPVVTTAIGGALEIIDNTCGVLVEPNDPAALASVLRPLIEDQGKRQKLRYGPSRAYSLCGIDTQMAKISKVLKTVLSTTGC